MSAWRAFTSPQVIGAATGLALASWTLELLVKVLPVSLPSFLHIGIDRSVLVFTAGLAITTGVLLGVLPGWNASGSNLSETLKEGSKGSAGAHRRRLGSALVMTEVALTMILMIGAGLLLKSVGRMLTANMGFRTDHLVTMRFYVPNRKYEGDAKQRFGPDLAEHLATVPGVESAAVTFIDPFVWGGFQRGFTGRFISRIPASSGLRPLFRLLQRQQAVTMFSQVFRPPLAMGMT